MTGEPQPRWTFLQGHRPWLWLLLLGYVEDGGGAGVRVPMSVGAHQAPPCLWVIFTSGRRTKSWALLPRQVQAAETPRTRLRLRATDQTAVTPQAGRWVVRPLQDSPPPGASHAYGHLLQGSRPPEAQLGTVASPQHVFLGQFRVSASWEIWLD